MEITVEELTKLSPENVYIVDIRDETAFESGHIDGAVNISADDIILRDDLPRDKKIILYCRSGILSASDADILREKDYDAYSLSGGYTSWIAEKLSEENNYSERTFKIEQSIRKTFHNVLWSRFAKAVITYELVKPGDNIAVCISGGKDSMLMAKLFQEMQAHGKFPFGVKFLVMDPGYSPANRAVIEGNAKILGIPITIFETDIFGSVFNVKNNPCYLCARMRRGHLYNKAKELGCNKIALGHHFDDVIETNLMSMIYGGQVQTMLPKLHSSNFEGMQLIRPMYFVRERDIIRWRNFNDLHFLQCACKFTENCSSCDKNGESASKRLEIKHLIADLAKRNPQIEQNIFRSMENINLNSVMSYKLDGEIHSFLDGYDD